MVYFQIMDRAMNIAIVLLLGFMAVSCVDSASKYLSRYGIRKLAKIAIAVIMVVVAFMLAV